MNTHCTFWPLLLLWTSLLSVLSSNSLVGQSIVVLPSILRSRIGLTWKWMERSNQDIPLPRSSFGFSLSILFSLRPSNMSINLPMTHLVRLNQRLYLLLGNCRHCRVLPWRYSEHSLSLSATKCSNKSKKAVFFFSFLKLIKFFQNFPLGKWVSEEMLTMEYFLERFMPWKCYLPFALFKLVLPTHAIARVLSCCSLSKINGLLGEIWKVLERYLMTCLK